MIKIENVEVVGWEAAIRGMRNPMNSWGKSDSYMNYYRNGPELKPKGFYIGPNDHDLMMRLAKGGPVHAKYRRMIVAYADITAPLYWWKEADQSKVGMVTNSCSTMHKIHAKEFTLDDFSHEHLIGIFRKELENTILKLNIARNTYIYGGEVLDENGDVFEVEPKDKRLWWQMIQLLPSSYNQKRTVMLNYEVLTAMYRDRKNHKLDCWRDFCKWIETLPYSGIITGKEKE